MWRCDMFLCFIACCTKDEETELRPQWKSVHQRRMTKNQSFHSMSPSLQWHSVGLTNLANSYELWILRRPPSLKSFTLKVNPFSFQWTVRLILRVFTEYTEIEVLTSSGVIKIFHVGWLSKYTWWHLKIVTKMHNPIWVFEEKVN